MSVCRLPPFPPANVNSLGVDNEYFKDVTSYEANVLGVGGNGWGDAGPFPQGEGGEWGRDPPPPQPAPPKPAHHPNTSSILLLPPLPRSPSSVGGLKLTGGGPWTAAALALAASRHAAGVPSARCPPFPWPVPPPAPRGSRGRTVEWYGVVVVVVVPRPAVCPPVPVRPLPAPRGTRTMTTALSAAPCAATPEWRRLEKVEWPMCLKTGWGGFKISVFLPNTVF